MSNDNDLIRRGDVIAILSAASRTAQKTIDALAAIPAVRVGVTPEEATLEEQIEKLRNLCDCDCDDEDCVKCAHYPAILEQKKDELARIRSALTVTTYDPAEVQALVEAAQDAAGAIDMAYDADDDEDPHRHSSKLRAAIAKIKESAKAAAIAAWKEGK